MLQVLHVVSLSLHFIHDASKVLRLKAFLSIQSLRAREKVTLVLNVMAPGDRDQYRDANSGGFRSCMQLIGPNP